MITGVVKEVPVYIKLPAAIESYHRKLFALLPGVAVSTAVVPGQTVGLFGLVAAVGIELIATVIRTLELSHVEVVL